MGISWQQFLLQAAAFTLLIFAQLTNAQLGGYIHHNCSEDGNYTNNSTYRANLHTLLATLSSNNDITYGFYNFSVGEDHDKVSAIGLCRGDVSLSECQTCIAFSTADILERCPTEKEAIIWYDHCMLRYSNRSIFNTNEGPNYFSKWKQDAADTLLLNKYLYPLMYSLRDQAATGNSTRKFAVGQSDKTDFGVIYGLVQCTPDLSSVMCANCLSFIFIYIDKYLGGNQRGSSYGPSCGFRYSLERFYEITADALQGGRTGKQQPMFRMIQNTIVIVVSTLAFVALLIGICILILLKRRKAKHGSKERHILFSTDAHDITFTESLQFDFETIRVATDNFKSDNKLGQGGFGSVYKGKLIEGKEIAVKRLAAHSRQGDHEFTNEVVILVKLQHRNLVRLLGYCLEGNERLLIYEFVPNSSLDHFLFDPLKSVHLDWEMRYKIISGIAKGILYLHEDSRLRIIHRDLKAGNILLDEEMCPKIADFGMARLFILNQTQGDTTRIVGTYGYMAPEYAMHGKFSVKSDVYSFGILLLEIISGQKNSRFCNGDMPRELPTFAWENWKAGTARNIIDPTVIDGHINDILRSIHIGLLCVQDSVSARPTMASVVLMLSSASQSLPLPSKPAYLSSIEPEMTITCMSGGKVGTSTVNQVSISDLLPR